jgi:hypothetical protein
MVLNVVYDGLIIGWFDRCPENFGRGFEKGS